VKKIIIGIIVLLSIFPSRAQLSKPLIDSGMLGSWPSLLSDIQLSDDGRYVAYTVGNRPVGSNTLVLQSIQTNSKPNYLDTFAGSYNPFKFYFSADSRQLLWQRGDSLFLKSTGQGQQKLLAVLSGPCLTQGRTKVSWLAWRDKNEPKDLVLYNLLSGQKKVYLQATDAMFNENGTILLVQQDIGKHSLRWVTLGKKIIEAIIWKGDSAERATSLHLDGLAQQLCFLVRKARGPVVYYYQTGRTNAIEKYNAATLSRNWHLTSLRGFNQTGHYLLANLVTQKESHTIPDLSMVAVDVWSYRDQVIHPAQISDPTAKYSYDKNGLLSIPSGESHDPATVLDTTGLIASAYHDYCILNNDTIAPPLNSPEHWVIPAQRMWLQPLKGGKRKELPFNKGNYGISPSGRWLLFWVNKRGQRADFYSYEIATGKTSNITGTLQVSVAQQKIHQIDSIPVGIAGWYAGDEAVLLYDNYDIWKVDPSCKEVPLNVTGGYGLRNNIKLQLVAGGVFGLRTEPLNEREELLLTGYNEQTKYNGFLKLQLAAKGKKELQLLSMQPFSWFKTSSQLGATLNGSNTDLGIMPLTGGWGKEQVWVLLGQSAMEYANYYYTRDFRKFIMLTSLQPHKKYNWLTTELVNWSLPDGQIGQGILFKPENFDSTKKYPVIFNYYEGMSGWMYQFNKPGLSDNGAINIPWFVSRGYLVFTPDIPVSNGSVTGISTGDHAWLAVESAAKYLSKRIYVDSTRLGLQGTSFGGQLTLCIYTRSKRFAAAAEGTGFTDAMSEYLGLIYNYDISLEVTTPQGYRENGHALYGATPWEKPELYLKNSPVWRADQIGGPLLIMHNKRDDQVAWKQGVEMYMALRRLTKPCWMLQYDGEGHGLDGNAAKDYTIRMTQYFDHYLKGKPAPRWMTQGIPARFKQVENRYELDSIGNCSKDCRICKQKTYH
jgi:dienelactone hydrolase